MLRPWLNEIARRLSARYRRGRRRPFLVLPSRPRVETLEVRLVPTTVTWIATTGTWNTPGDWSTGVVPGSGDNVVIPSTGNVTFGTGTTSTVAGLDNEGTFTLSGGTLTVNGTFNGAGTNKLSGGTLSGATVDAATTIVGTLNGGTLNAVTVNGTLDLATNNNTVTATNGLTINGTVNIGNQSNTTTSGQIIFSGTQILGGTGTIDFGTSANNDLFTGSSTTLTIGSSLTIQGQSGKINGNGPIINNGLIDATTSGHTITIDATPQIFTNNGTVEGTGGGSIAVGFGATGSNAGMVQVTGGGNLTVTGGNTISTFNGFGNLSISGGGTLLINSGNANRWQNTGVISATSPSAVDLGGTFTQDGLTASGGTFTYTGPVNIVGTLTGGLTLTSATGSWNLGDPNNTNAGVGTLSGGAFNASGGATLFATFESALSGMTLNSPIDMSTFNNSVTVTNGLTLNNVTLNLGNQANSSTAGQLIFNSTVTNPTQTLGGTGIINFGFFNNSFFVGSSPVTIGSGITIQGRGGNLTGNSALTNNGLIDANISGGSFSISSALPSFTNTNLVEATNGASISVSFGATGGNTGTVQATGGGNLTLTGGNTSSTFTGFGNVSITGGTLAINSGNANPWQNTATISATGSTVELGGTFTQASLGTVAINPLIQTSAPALIVNSGPAVTIASSNGATESGNTVTITTTAAHGFVVGQQVVLSGIGIAGYNGTFTIASVTSTTFTYINPTSGLAASGGGTARVYGINIVGRVTGGLTLNSSTGSWNLGDPNNGNAGTGTLSGTATIASSNGATESGNTVTITTTAPHGFVVGQQVIVSGVGVGGYNGTFTIASVTTPTTFTYTNSTTGLAASGGGTAAVGFVFSTSGGASLVATFSSALSGVTLNGPIDLSTFNNTVTVTNGLTLNNVTLNLGNPTNSSTAGQLTFNGTQTLGGTGTINFGFFNNAIFTGSSAPLTIGSGITIQGRGGNFTGNSAITNNGVIDASIPGGSFGISSTLPSFTNNGTVEATGGATITVNPQTLTNISSGTLTGGTWEAVGGSTLYTGSSVASGPRAITTDAASVLLDGSGSHFYSGTTGNTNAFSSLATIGTAGSFTIQNGASATTSAALSDAGSLTIQTGTLVALSGLTVASTGTLIGSGNAVLNEVQTIFVNVQGTPPANPTFQLLYSNASTSPLPVGASAAQVQSALNQLGTITGAGGSVTVTGGGAVYRVTFGGNLAGTNLQQIIGFGSTGPNGSVVVGSTAIQATIDGSVTNSGTVYPGTNGTAGTLSVTGNYTQTSSGNLALEIGGTAAGQFDVLSASGTDTLDGSLGVTVVNGFAPGSGQSFPILTFGSVSGDFATKNGLNPTNPPSSVHFTPVYSANSLTLNAAPNIPTVTNTNDSGPGSLRQAILDGDAIQGGSPVIFAIPGGGVQTISLLSALPAITQPLDIDATTQPGYAGTPLVQLFGGNAGSGVNGLTVSISGSTIKGLTIGGFSGNGIELDAGGNLIAADWIGTDAGGTAASANGDGILINGSANNTIGGTTAAARNVISGNTSDGVILTGTGTTGNVVEGNYIGTSAGGTAALGNGLQGVEIEASGNTVGGTAAGAGNVISANGFDGIRINGVAGPATGNVVQGNTIGTNAAGTAALGSSRVGVYVQVAANNTIGGTAPGAGNVISGNAIVNVNLVGAGTAGNVVQGNVIGLDVGGTTPLAATNVGIQVATGASGNLIGGTTSAARNVISGNKTGVLLSGGTVTGNRVQGNFIGTDVTGSAAAGNTSAGVGIQNGANGNSVGDTAAGVGNVIAFNGANGVDIDGAATTNNPVRGNSIHDNTGLGIALTGGAVGAAAFAPTLSSGVGGSNSTTIAGRLTGVPNTSFDLDFFANPADPQGQTYLGSATIITDPTGLALFNVTLGTGNTAGMAFTATASATGANTTQFSNAIAGAGQAPAVAISGPLSATVDIPVPEFTAVVSGATQAPPYSFLWSVTETGNPAFTLPANVATTGQSFSFTPTQPGNYTVTATVTDALGNRGTASQVVAVGVAGPGIVITNDPAVSTVNKALTLTSAPADDGGTAPTSYAWTLTLNGQSYVPTGATTNAANLTFTPTQNGLYALALTATFTPGVVSTTTAYLVVTGGVPATSIAGAPKSALEGTPITLAATADPSLSGTLTYIWTVTKNGATFATQTDTRADVFSFTPDTAGSYQAFLTIKDAAGDTSSAPSVTIPVTAVPPTAAIIQFPTGATAGTPVQLAGSGSTPGTADAVTGLVWSVYSSGAGKVIAAGSGTAFAYTPTTAGVDVVTLTVTNAGGASNSASVVIPVAAAPLALPAAGPFQAGSAAQLTLSNPTSGPTYTFTWAVTGQTVPYGLSGTGASVQFAPTLPGQYLVSATAHGSDGSVFSGSQVYTVALAPLAATIFGAPKSGLAGQPITLTDSATDANRKGPLAYLWTVIKNGAAFSTPNNTGEMFTFTPDAAATYQVSLTVSDTGTGEAATATAASVTIPVTAGVATVAVSGAPTTSVLAGQPIAPLSATASIAGSTDTFSLKWSVFSSGAGGVVATGTGSTFSYTPSAAGADFVTVMATDTSSGQVTASTVVVTVTATTATVTLGQSGPLQVGSATMTATMASPPPGANYAWNVTGVGFPFSAISSGSPSSFNFAPTRPGTYKVSVIVTGSDGTVATATRTVAVTGNPLTVAINNVPTTAVPEGTAVNLAAGVTDLVLLAAYSYVWQVTGPEGFVLNGNGPSLGFTPVESGSYSVQLIVTDTAGDRTGATATFAVQHVAPAPVIESGPGTSISGSTLTLNLTASVTDPASDDHFLYTWFANQINSTTRPIGQQQGSGASFTFTGDLTTSFGVELTVQDDDGGFGRATTIVLVAPAGTTLVLNNNNVPAGVSQVLAIAAGNATIDARNLPASVTVVEVALGGHDTLFAGPGPSILQGDSGSNLLQGYTGPDTLIATANDTLIGGTGPSNLFQMVPGAGEVATAGTSNNTLSFAQASTPVTIDLTQNAGQTQLFSAGGSVALTGAFQTLMGGTGADMLTAAPSTTVFGGGGNDTLLAGAGSNINLVAGSGNVLLGAAGGTSVALFGGAGNDSLSATGGSGLTLMGGSGNDTLSVANAVGALVQAGAGNATLLASGGTSITLFGGTGSDTLSSTGGSGVTLIGGTGRDSLSTSDASNVLLLSGSGTVTSLPTSGGSSITLFGAAGSDTLSSTGGTGITLVGGTGNDSLSVSNAVGVLLQGGSGTGSLSAVGGSSVTMFGGTGNDSMSSSGGSGVTMQGGTGNDMMLSANGSNVLMQGGTGSSTMIASGGSSITMFGGAGNDSLTSVGGSTVTMQGGSGNVTLTASGGTSITMFGGTGNDSLSSSGGTNVTMVGGSGCNTMSASNGVGVILSGNTGTATLIASGGSSVTMFGGTGNDSLTSSGGSSVTMIGGTGNDSLLSSNGSNISMQGGNGNATLTALGGSSITLFGGAGNDSLSSTGGTTVTMVGGSGNVTLAASGGTSITMFGGTGNDSLISSGGSSVTMIGGTGNATLSAANGSNVSMQGGSGNATLTASGGSSVTMFGGAGNDSLASTGGTTVTMVGGSGNVTLTASGGTSITMFGGTGNDSLISSGGSSVTMLGGTGNATLLASGGTSITMFGGTGNDSLASSGGNSITMQGGSGNVTLSSTNGSNVSMQGGTGNSTLVSSGGSSITLFGGTGNDSLASTGGASVTMVGGTGSDTMSSSSGSNVSMQGGNGNVTMTASGGSSITMFGGAGNDSLSSTSGSSVTMVGGSGNDLLSSSSGSNVSMQGGSGNATLTASGGSSITMFGGAGNDSLSSSGGTSVTMIGGGGSDTLSATGAASLLMVGGTGNSTLTSSGGTSVTMFGGTGNDSLASTGGNSTTMQGGSGNDLLSSSDGSNVSMQGGSGNATLTASGGTSITMFGGTGNDSLASTGGNTVTMVGGTGNSTLTSGSGGTSITMFGGTGNDTLTASAGTSITMIGGSGNDLLTSTGGSSVLMIGGTTALGGSGTDTLTATGGSSITLFGGTGNDSLSSSGGTGVTMIGGSGNDALSQTNGTNVSMLGGSGNSTLSSSGGSSVTMFGGSGNYTLSSAGGSGVTMFGGTGNDSLTSTGGSGITMAGGTGNDALSSTGDSGVSVVGGSGNNTLAASGGSSVTLFGGTGNDSLTSSSGTSVTVIGGSGNDTLSQTSGTAVVVVGGSGTDTMSSTGGSSITLFGGTGNDSLASSGGTGVTVIGGSGTDTLSQSGGTNVSMLGGSGNATLTSSGGSSVTLYGGTGNDSLASSGGSSVTMVGGSGVDTLSNSTGTAVLMIGGDGRSTLTASGATSITLFGGTGNDTLASTDGSGVTLIGGSGTDTLTSTGDRTGMAMAGGGGNDSLTSTGDTSVTLFGGTGNDTLSADGGSAITLAGLEGYNVYNVSDSAGSISVTLDDLATFGQIQGQTDSQTLGINTIEFPGVTSGITLDLSNASVGEAPTPGEVQQVTADISVTLIGQFQNIVLSGGDNDIHGGSVANVLVGGSGNDTLAGGSGPVTLIPGSGNDFLVAGSGGTTFRFAGTPGHFGTDTIDPPAGSVVNALDFSQFGGPVTLNLGSTAKQTVSGSGLVLILQDPNEINALFDSAFDDTITGNAVGDAFYVGAGNDSFLGGGGSDTFYFSGSQLGSDTIDEKTTTNTLNFYGFGGPININLTQSAPQLQGQSPASSLSVTLTNPSAINQVVGSPYGGTIVGNDNVNETLIGGGGLDSIVAGGGNDYIQAHVNQVIYLEFPTADQTPTGDHVYTPDEEAAVLQGMQRIYADFNYFFTLDLATAQQQAQVTGGNYITQLFDAGAAGGSSNALDPHDLTLSGTSYINVNPFLDINGGSVPSTSANIVGLSTTIAAHELGHLSGLQHQDAFGPIGTGLFGAVNPSEFGPTYAGPTGAAQTPQDIMASPASVGSTLLDAAGTTYLGERDAVKLAFNATGTTVPRSSLPTQAVGLSVSNPANVAGLSSAGTLFTIPSASVLGNQGTLPALAVPTTAPTDAGLTYAVTATDVSATLSGSEEDFYAFTGQTGELMNFQVISRNNTLNPAPFSSELVLVGPSGQVIAFNQHEFESSDSTLLDVTLPADGTYYVGVDPLTPLPTGTSGNYQLFLYSFATTTGPSTAPGNTLVGGSGSDTLVGSSGNDQFRVATASTTIVGGSGQAIVNETAAVPLQAPTTAPGGSLTVISSASSATTTTLTASPPSPTFGQPVTLTATVSGAGTPSGTVIFVDQATGQQLGTAVVNGSGQASITTTALSGSASVEAIYVPASSGTQPVATQSSSGTLSAPITVTPTHTLPTITITDAGGTYNGAAFPATAPTLDGIGLTLTYYAGSSATGTPLPGAPTNAGTYTVVASFPGDQDYAGESNIAQTTFTIAQATATINVTGYSVTYDGSAHTATGTVSGLGNTDLSADLNFGDTAHTNAGSYSDSWTFTDPNGNYASASGTVSDSIARANATINITAYSVPYDTTAHAAIGTVTGVLGEDLGGLLNLTSTAHTNAGSYSDTWTFTDPAGNYNSASGTISDGITQANAVFSVTGYGVTYDGGAHTATGTATGLGNTDLSADLNFGGTAHTNAGSYSDSWTFTDPAGNYASTSGPVGDSIAQADSTTTVSDAGGTYNGSAFAATPSVTGAGTVTGSAALDYTNTDTGADLGGTAPVNAGHYLVTATYAGDANHTGSASVPLHFTLAQADSTTTVSDAGGTYNGSAFAATASVTGAGGLSTTAVSLDYTNTDTGTDLGAVAPVDAGHYLVTATYAGDANHTGSTSVPVQFTIAQASATVTVTPYSVTYDGSPHTATGTVTGVNGENLGGLILSGTAHTNAGSYSDSWTFTDTTGNYVSTSGTVSDDIAKADAAINLTAYSTTYDTTAHAAIGTVTGILGEDLSGLLNLNATAHTNAGTYTDSWSFAGNDNYNSASGTVADSIAKADVTINVTAYSTTYDGTAQTATGSVTGVGSDGTLSSGLLDLSGTTHTNAGSYTDTWTFAGNDNYNSTTGTVNDTIAQAAFTYPISNDSQTAGTPANLAADLGTTIPTGVNGENLDITYASSGDTATATAGTYPITGTLSNGTGLLSNYTVTLNPGTLTVIGVTGPNASVYVLDTATSGATFSLSGSANVNEPGAIVVESSSPTALTASGNVQVTAASIQVNGSVSTSGHAHLSPKPITGAASPGDPLAGLPVPSVSGSAKAINVTGSTSLTIDPGVYSQISVSGSGKLIMNPGIYVLAGGGFSVTVNGSVSGSGVLIYNAGSSYPKAGGTFGAITLSGNGQVSLSAAADGSYAGIVLFQSRDNSKALTLSGNAVIGLNGGLVYAADALLTISGSGDLHHTPLVVKDLQISGRALANAQLAGGSSGPGTADEAGALAGGVAFTTGPQTLTAGAASTAITVSLVDPNNNPVAAGSGGVTLALGSTSGGGTFLDAAGHPLPDSTVTIPEGSSTARFEYEDAAVGYPTLTATAPGLGGEQQEIVTAGTPVYSPSQVRTAYGVNNLSWDGTGQTIAIVDAYDDPSIFDSLDVFDAQFTRDASGQTLYQQYGPAASFLTVLNQDGGTVLPTTDPAGAGAVNWEVEEALDVEWVHAIAPGAQIVLIEANSATLPDLMAGVATAADLPDVSVVSMSWGFVEGQDVLAADEAKYDSYFTTPAGHQGVVFVASTGDYGAGVPQYPAFSPNVVSVGGTSLAVNGDYSYKGEIAWGNYDGSLGSFVGAGGGISQYEGEPTYQMGMQSTGQRTTPDVSFLADPNTGAWLVDSYNLAAGDPWEIAGGTSLAAPSWAALLALANQGRAAAGTATLGSAGPMEAQTALYGLSAGDFHDVTTGSNGFAAGLGYDLVTGLGTPIADRLVPDLVSYAGGPASATSVAPIAPSGLVLNVNATNGAGVANAVARAAALRIFAAEIVTGPAHAIAPAAGTTPAPAIATQAPATEHETSHGTGTREMSPVTAVPVAVPPGPTADARSTGSLPSWSGVILDASSAFGVLPAGAAVGLRPEMSADGGGDVLLGGRGDDLLVGGEGRNLLVGGYTDGRAARDAVMAEDWAADCRGEGLHFFDSYFFRDGDDGADLADGQ